VGHAGRSPREGARVRGGRLHVPGAVSARRRRAADDRYVRQRLLADVMTLTLNPSPASRRGTSKSAFALLSRLPALISGSRQARRTSKPAFAPLSRLRERGRG